MKLRAMLHTLSVVVIAGIASALLKGAWATNPVNPVSEPISTNETDSLGHKCYYTVDGSWLLPDQTWSYPYRNCTSALYDQLTDPNNPNSKLSCRLVIAIGANTSPQFILPIGAKSYIAYPSSGGQVNLLGVDYATYEGNQPGFKKTQYKAHASFNGYYFAGGPQFKVQANGITKASSAIW